MILRFIKNRPQLVAILFIFILTWYISAFWYQFMILQGDSMAPAIYSGQFLILDKHTKSYTNDDVVAVKKKGINGLLVKRIVAIPGDSVYIKDGMLYINGQMKETHNEIEFEGIAKEPITLGSECYFVLGDNINHSKDSRYEEIGIIYQDEIKGEVLKY